MRGFDQLVFLKGGGIIYDARCRSCRTYIRYDAPYHSTALGSLCNSCYQSALDMYGRQWVVHHLTRYSVGPRRLTCEGSR